MSDETFITLLVAAVAVGLFLVASVLVPNFFQPLTMLNLVTNNWAVISLGVGVTFLLVSGNFDLSVGGIVALSGVLAVWLAQSSGGANPLSTGLGLPYWLAVAGALAGALAVGGLNALFVVRFSVPSIIVTLGTMMLARGIAQVITAGFAAQYEPSAEFGVPGNLTMFGTSIKLPVVLMAVLLIVAALRGEEDHLRPAHLPDRGQPGRRPAVRDRPCPAPDVPLSLQRRHRRVGRDPSGVGVQVGSLEPRHADGVRRAGGRPVGRRRHRRRVRLGVGMFFGALILAVVTTAATGLVLSPDWQFILKAVAVFLAIMTQTWALALRNR